jgi:hypothetical protein
MITLYSMGFDGSGSSPTLPVCANQLVDGEYALEVRTRDKIFMCDTSLVKVEGNVCLD